MDSPLPTIAALFTAMKTGNDARRQGFGLAERRAALHRLPLLLCGAGALGMALAAFTGGGRRRWGW